MTQITEQLDKISSEFEEAGRPDIAQALDRVSDGLERQAKSDDDDDILTVKCRDGDKNLARLVRYIGDIGNTGHSFSIIVDPEGKGETYKSFGWDGDGSDRVNEVKLNGEKIELNDKGTIK